MLNSTIGYLFVFGISSGIPFFLVLSSLSFWLTESQVSSTLIGLFTWVTLPYSLKFLCSPLLDYLKSHRFSGHPLCVVQIWATTALLGVIGSTVCLSCLSPQTQIISMACWALILSFCAALFDIAVDTLRIDLCPQKKTGIAAAIESIGFRIGMMIGGAGTLYLASCYSWQQAYLFMAIVQVLGVPFIWFTKKQTQTSITLKKIVQQKSKHFLLKQWQESLSSLKEYPHIFALISFIFFLKIPDTILNALSAPFLYQIGFNKIEYATVTKIYGIPLMICGSFVAGYLADFFSYRFLAILVLFLQSVSCLLFISQYHTGYDLFNLTLNVGIESFTSGMAATCLMTIITHHTQKKHAASHFTFLMAISSLSRLIFSFLGGMIADFFGWIALFLLACFSAIPAFFQLKKIK